MTTIPDQAPASLVNNSGADFPLRPYDSLGSYFAAYRQQIAVAGRSLEPAALDRAAAILLEAYASGRTVFCCGNGGSAAIANHLQCDHVKGIRTATDLSPRVVSLSSNIELLTAIANDVAYDQVFEYQLQSLAVAGDVLIAVSSSGRSLSIVRALAWARLHDVRTIALTGFEGGDARSLAEVSLHVDAANYGIVEDMHMAVVHALAQYIRQTRMSPEAISASVF